MSFSAKLMCIDEATTEERATARYRMLLKAVGEQPGLGQSDVTVHDLSTEGFLLETDAPMAVGAEISLDLPATGPVSAELVWSSGRFFGGRFYNPLAPSTVNAAAAHSPVVWPDFPGSAKADASLRSAAGEKLIEEQGALVQERLPHATRLRIIFGASAMFWAAATGLVWAIV